MVKARIGYSVKQNTFIYLISNVIHKSIPFLLLPILTRYLTTTDYGVIAMYMALVALASTFVSLNAESAVGRAFFDYSKSDLSRYVGTVLTTGLLSAALIGFLLLLFRAPFVIWAGIDWRWLLLVPVLAMARFLFQTRITIWHMQQKPVPCGALVVSQSIIDLGLSIGLVMFFAFSWQGRLAGVIAAELVFAMIGLFLMVREGFFTPSWNQTYAKAAFRFGLPLIPHSLSFWIRGSLDRFVIVFFLGLDAVGLYYVAFALASAVAVLSESFTKSWTPHIYSVLGKSNEEHRRHLVRKTYQFMGLLAVASAVYAIFIMNSGGWLFGAEFSKSLTYLPFLIIAQVLGGWTRCYGVYIFYQKRTELRSLISIFAGVVHIVLLWWMTSTWGVLGAALSFAISSLVAFVLTVWTSHQVHPMPWGFWKPQKAVT